MSRVKSVQCPLRFQVWQNFHNILFLRRLNYSNQLSVTINSYNNVKKKHTKQEKHTENSNMKFDKKLYQHNN